MSILNRPSDGSAPILLTIWKMIRKLKPMSKAQVLALCAPATLHDNEKRANKTLLRWSQLGLFIEADDKVQLAKPFDKIDVDGLVDYRSFRREVRRLVLSEQNNQGFLKPEPPDAADFTLAASWLLSTDVFAGYCTTFSTIERAQNEQVEPIGEGHRKFVIQNDTRWGGFRDWCAFLGLGWDASPFLLDPTEAIEDDLDEIFSSKSKLTIDDFVSRLGEQLPVVDSGTYFHRARDCARPAWRAIEDNEISPALTLALLRLENAKRLVLEQNSDANSRAMLGEQFAQLRTVSHIRLVRPTR
jgi:hypothetical protein